MVICWGPHSFHASGLTVPPLSSPHKTKEELEARLVCQTHLSQVKMEVCMMFAAREGGWRWRKARAWALIVSVFTVTFLAVTESQAGRSEPAGAGWPNQALCCLEHSVESHPLWLVGGQGPVWVLPLSPFLLGSLRPSILLAIDTTAFFSTLRQENGFLELPATRTRLSVRSQGLEKDEGVPLLSPSQHL